MSAYDMFGLKCYLHPYIYHVNAVKDDKNYSIKIA